MSANAEEVVAEVLRLVAGRGETVVGLTASGPVRFDYWACGLWSVERERYGVLGDVAVGLWLRYTLDRYLDRETADAVMATQTYKAMKETAEEFGLDMKYEELNFRLAELKLQGIYGMRAVYKLKPFKCSIKVLAVRLRVPMWSLCAREERETCKKRVELTEKVRSRGVPVEDVVRGIYVPVDASELEILIRRVL